MPKKTKGAIPLKLVSGIDEAAAGIFAKSPAYGDLVEARKRLLELPENRAEWDDRQRETYESLRLYFGGRLFDALVERWDRKYGRDVASMMTIFEDGNFPFPLRDPILTGMYALKLKDRDAKRVFGKEEVCEELREMGLRPSYDDVKKRFHIVWPKAKAAGKPKKG